MTMLKRLIALLLAMLLLTPAAMADGVSVTPLTLTDGQRLLKGYDEASKTYVYLNFGRYPQEKDGTVLPCLWRVLAIQDGYAFLLNEYVLEFMPFHTEKVDQPTWKDYKIFTDMNGDMLNTMFTAEEQALLKNSDELGRLFILDNDEYMTPAYGFRKIMTKIEKERECAPTPYAMTRPKAYRESNGKTWYWSRTCRHTAAGGYEWIIGYNGHISMAGFLRVGGVRPACYVDAGRLDHASGSGTMEDPYVFEIAE